MRRLPVLLAALPALLVAAVGLTHPEVLTPETADAWFVGHLVLLPLFPAVAVSLWWVLSGERSPAAWGARILAYGWVVLYGALDAIAGVGLSYQVKQATANGTPQPNLGDTFRIADTIGRPGALLFAAAGLFAALAVLRHGALAVLGGVVVAVGSVVVYERHVFPPAGVLGMVAIGIGLGMLAWGTSDRLAATIGTRQLSTNTSPRAASGKDSGAASSTVSTTPSGP